MNLQAVLICKHLSKALRWWISKGILLHWNTNVKGFNGSNIGELLLQKWNQKGGASLKAFSFFVTDTLLYALGGRSKSIQKCKLRRQEEHVEDRSHVGTQITNNLPDVLH